VGPVEQSVPEALEASGLVPPAAAAEDEAGTAADAARTAGLASGAAAAAAGTGIEAEGCYPTQQEHLPLLILNLPPLALGVEGSINQLIEAVEAVVHERILQVVIQSLPEALLLIAIMGDLSGGVASELEKTVTVLSHRHSSLK
jgi:hypothetical protein